MQHQLRGAGFQFGQRKLSQQRHRIVVQFIPARRIQIEKQAGRIVVPTPPQIARQGPQPLLQRSNETIKRSGFAHNWSDLGGRFRQHSNLVFAENAGLDRLHDQNALQNSAIDQRNSQERLVGILASVPKILKPGMILHLFDRNRPHQFRHQASEAFVHRHPQTADTLAAKPNGCRQHQIGAVRLQQISRAHVRSKSLGDQGNNIHQRFRRLAALRCEIRDLFQAQDVPDLARMHALLHGFSYVLVCFQSDSLASVGSWTSICRASFCRVPWMTGPAEVPLLPLYGQPTKSRTTHGL